jgi:uncharacterized protein
MDYPKPNPALPAEPLSNEELEALDDLLLALPTDGAMNIEGMDGYLTALLVGPPLLDTLQTADWLPAVWGGDATEPGRENHPFASGKQRKRAVVLVLRHLQSLRLLLRDNPQGWEPIFSVAEEGDDELVSAEDWCMGFLQAVDLAPEVWSPVFDDTELGPLLVPVVLLGGEDAERSADEAARLADPGLVDGLSRTVADAVLKLWERGMAAKA